MTDFLNDAIARKQKLETASGWIEKLHERVEALTVELIAANNEQTRGAIKELRRLIELPETLQIECDREAAALSDNSDAA